MINESQYINHGIMRLAYIARLQKKKVKQIPERRRVTLAMFPLSGQQPL